MRACCLHCLVVVALVCSRADGDVISDPETKRRVQLVQAHPLAANNRVETILPVTVSGKSLLRVFFAPDREGKRVERGPALLFLDQGKSIRVLRHERFCQVVKDAYDQRLLLSRRTAPFLVDRRIADADAVAIFNVIWSLEDVAGPNPNTNPLAKDMDVGRRYRAFSGDDANYILQMRLSEKGTILLHMVDRTGAFRRAEFRKRNAGTWSLIVLEALMPKLHTMPFSEVLEEDD